MKHSHWNGIWQFKRFYDLKRYWNNNSSFIVHAKNLNWHSITIQMQYKIRLIWVNYWATFTFDFLPCYVINLLKWITFRYISFQSQRQLKTFSFEKVQLKNVLEFTKIVCNFVERHLKCAPFSYEYRLEMIVHCTTRVKHCIWEGMSTLNSQWEIVLDGILSVMRCVILHMKLVIKWCNGVAVNDISMKIARWYSSKSSWIRDFRFI